jgi:hypothetical protein
VADEQGYIYQRQQLSAAELHDLVSSATQGWASDPTDLWQISAGKKLEQLGDEGRATVGVQEFRWRRTDETTYDALCLSLLVEAPAGFVLLSDRKQWRVRPTTCRQPGARLPPSADTDLPAVAFLAPNGAVQFVALIDGKNR